MEPFDLLLQRKTQSALLLSFVLSLDFPADFSIASSYVLISTTTSPHRLPYTASHMLALLIALPKSNYASIGAYVLQEVSLS